MTSLIAPIGIWQSLPNSTITCATATRDGSRIVTGLCDGNIFIWTWNKDRTSLSPLVYLIGHSKPIISLVVLNLETEDLKTGLISVTCDQECALWDMEDGRCQVVRKLSCTCISKFGQDLLAWGDSALCLLYTNLETKSIIQTPSLIISLDVIDSRIVCLYQTSVAILGISNNQLKVFSSIPLTCNPLSRVYWNQFDSHMFMIVNPLETTIYHYDSSIIKLCSINLVERKWKGAKFLSSKSILMWDYFASSFIYYLGHESDFTCSKIKDVSSGAIILVSDGDSAVHVRALDNITKPCQATLISFSPGDKPGVLAYVPSDPVLNLGQQLVIFDYSPFNMLQIKLKQFWASLFCSNVNIQSSNDTQMIFPVQLKTANEYQVQNVASFPAKFSCIILLTRTKVCIGFENGKISIIPVQLFLSGILEGNDVNDLQHGSAPVSCLYVPDYSPDGKKHHLVSGSRDGSVALWDTDSLQCLGKFNCHAEAVFQLFTSPKTMIGKLKNCVVSIGLDSSLSLINLETLTKMYIFTGHTKPKDIYWRSVDDMMLVHCWDNRLFVWQLKTGHLDRIVEGPTVDEMLSSTESRCRVDWHILASVNFRKTLSLYQISEPRDNYPSIVVLQVNIKRLIDEIYNGEHVLTPTLTRKAEGITIIERPKPDNPIDLLLKTFKGSKSNKESSQNVNDLETFSSSLELDKRSGVPNPVVTNALFASLLSWGHDSVVDKQCMESLGMNPSKPFISVGYRGANGFLNFIVPKGMSDWSVSSYQTAQRLLAILSFMKCLMSTNGLEDQAIQLITHYGITIPSTPSYKHAALGFIIKYWQDPVPDVAQAARSLFETTLKNLSIDQKTQLINSLKTCLPLVSMNKSDMKACLILALICCQDSTLVHTRLSKDISSALEFIIREETKSPFRLLAIELFGIGFSIWEPHINGAQILRMLVSLTGLSQPISTATSPTMTVARQTLTSIASTNAPLVVNTLVFDILHSKAVGDRLACLRLLGNLIVKKPLLLYQYVPTLIEAMVKTLDPNHPSIRESLQDMITVNIAEMVTLSCVDFHAITQRLVVGSKENISIYDLRTATRFFQANTPPIHCVSFSPNGKLVAALSATENTVSFYQPSQGILGFYPGRHEPFRKFPMGPQQNLRLQDILQNVKITWTGERSCHVKCIEMELNFNV